MASTKHLDGQDLLNAAAHNLDSAQACIKEGNLQFAAQHIAITEAYIKLLKVALVANAPVAKGKWLLRWLMH